MIRSFKDIEAREWPVRVTVATVQRVADAIELDGKPVALAEIAGGPLLKRVNADSVLFGRVLYEVVRPEAERRQIDWPTFADALAGDALGQAGEALIEATIDFFGNPAQREMLRAGINAARRIGAQRATALKDELSDPNWKPPPPDQPPENDSPPNAETCSDSATNSPASSESTPAPSPSES